MLENVYIFSARRVKARGVLARTPVHSRVAKAAALYVFGGGINEDVAPLMVASDGTVTNGTYPQTKEFDATPTFARWATRTE